MGNKKFKVIGASSATYYEKMNGVRFHNVVCYNVIMSGEIPLKFTLAGSKLEDLPRFDHCTKFENILNTQNIDNASECLFNLSKECLQLNLFSVKTHSTINKKLQEIDLGYLVRVELIPE